MARLQRARRDGDAHDPARARAEGFDVIQPYAIGVCSWSLQVKSVPELRAFLDQLGVNVIQIACGDPHHAS